MKAIKAFMPLAWTLMAPLAVVQSASAQQTDDLRIENDWLAVTLRRADATLTVTDKRCGRTYRQFVPAGDPVFRVAPADAAGSVQTRAETARIAAVVKGPIEAVWTLEFGPHDGDLSSILTAPNLQAPLESELAFPYPFEVEPKRDWHALNVREGILLPVEDSVLFESRKKESKEAEWGNAWGADGSEQMKNWFGTTDLNSGVAVINPSTYDARLSLRLLDNPKRFVGAFVWSPSLDAFRYDRKLLYHFSPSGGYVALAKRARRHYVETGPWITLKQKRERLPSVDRLIGAVDIWLWRDTPYRAAEMEKSKDAGAPADPLLTPAFVKELKESGIGKALLSFSQHREDSPAAKRPRETISLPKEFIQAANQAGYLPLRYDNYTVPYEDRWSADEVKRLTVRKKDGSPYASPNGKPNVYYPWVLDLARKETRAELAECPQKARFYDTLPARPLIEAYMPGIAPSDRETTVKGRIDFARMAVEEMGLVIGGENLSALMIPYLHYNEGTMTMSGFTGHSESANKGYIDWPIDPILTAYGLNEYYRVPLNELVFHDCIVSTWHWRTENHKNESLWWKHDLFNVLYGTMPLWDLKPGLWKEYKDRFVQSYKNVCEAVFEKVGYDEMTDHRWLTPDRKVQESVFSSGARVIVNFGDAPYVAEGGRVVEARSFAVVAH